MRATADESGAVAVSHRLVAELDQEQIFDASLKRLGEALAEHREHIEIAIRDAYVKGMEQQSLATPPPVPMLLWCPECGERHLDEGEFATKAHHTHACQTCGMVWRPAKVATVGVQFLPDFKNAEDSRSR